MIKTEIVQIYLEGYHKIVMITIDYKIREEKITRNKNLNTVLKIINYLNTIREG